ncbi:uncharacterized protein LOC125490956 [Plutella xylostella]|uniref:uncharacterized protein LOC125490956 n=1 Tax=Plutella xylostella TaxID=51655 RepID=UPI0020326C29|nr:uncharacterized protein LOC125490956 [Plutella xylostella]
MQPCLMLVALAALGAAAAAAARAGYEREIDAGRYNQVPRLTDYVLSQEFLAAHKNRAKLVTKWRPEEAIASDNVILESNVVRVVKPRRREGEELVRRRRGYNLEHVQVPARYPYLPVARFNRFRRWG